MEQKRWKRAREELRTCKGNLDKISDDQIFVQHFKSLERIGAYYQAQDICQPLDDVCGIWIWGPRYTGKSHVAETMYPRTEFIQFNVEDEWVVGYTAEHKAIVIHEVDPSAPRKFVSTLKKMTDKWPFLAKVKFSGGMIRPQQVIVTSNYTIQECFPYPDDLEALQRRFKVIYMPDIIDPTLAPQDRKSGRQFVFDKLNLSRQEMERRAGVTLDLPMFNMRTPETVEVDRSGASTVHPGYAYLTPLPLKRSVAIGRLSSTTLENDTPDRVETPVNPTFVIEEEPVPPTQPLPDEFHH